MAKPCIICVAITGSLPKKSDNPAVPVTVSEQIESTQAAFEAGATIVHAHVRDDNQNPTSDPELFARLKEGLERHCPGMVIQFSTGGRAASGRTRGGMLPLKPDMASLSVASNNFPTRVYENPPDLVDWLASEMRVHAIKPEIEAFDLSHIFKAAEMNADGRILGDVYIQFVMGVKNAMPVDRAVFHFYVETTKRSCRGPSGAPLASALAKSFSTNGRSRPAVTRGLALRTTSVWTDTRLPRRTPRWWRGSLSSAKNTIARSRRRSRRGPCSV